MNSNGKVFSKTRTMTRSICGDSGVVNLVLDSFIVSRMVIRSLFSYRAMLMSHPLPGQCTVNLQLVSADKYLSRKRDRVSIKKLRDKKAIPEMHSYSW